ncbi:penicillin-binding protein transpeptidase [Emticicia oligotrophica DSM 17448]|uniref:beta-lactamase n=1 Tax=Emticicia oligotrophica (strain DSM 17448 / CIP 109782 / MTCC 6937 / GPTSA100-15) TaxID=929562 RepID=A0ABM5N134_EMTOG|nr:penicillin-binding transpeptidase domain-containing protein [Emticicia oligotrophica]AFK03157.1 penicillin-binding protein transpeptidase [Emticicia oligotrophica DSM 17448]
MKIIRLLIFLYCLSLSFHLTAQSNFQHAFEECQIKGSTTIYDYQNKRWIYSDSLDAQKETLPASTFKIINLLIALETKVISDENQVIKWVGKTDTTLYGYRPEIYHDMSVKEAFEVSAGWVFIELAKKIGRKNYLKYLKACHYGNADLSEKGVDFWNFGKFVISPKNQITFLRDVYEEKLPFSKRNYEILKKVMITEQTPDYTIRSKTGWTRDGGIDSGWWVGYLEKNNNTYFFATRIAKKRSEVNPDFGQCRKTITRKILKQINAIN